MFGPILGLAFGLAREGFRGASFRASFQTGFRSGVRLGNRLRVYCRLRRSDGPESPAGSGAVALRICH